jgi:branched-chain amino acid transport system permease protein
VALFCAARLRRAAVSTRLPQAPQRQARPQALATDPSQLSFFQRVGKLGLPAFLILALTFPAVTALASGGLTEARYWSTSESSS